jgi:type IV pilus assembly protein PilB
MKLLQELYANGILSDQTKKQLEDEIEKNGKREEEVILEKKIVPEDSLFVLKSKVSGVPFKKVKAEDIPPEILELIPEEAVVNYNMAALSKNDNFVEIGMVYPEDIAAQNALRFLANQQKFDYKICLISISNLANLLKQQKNLSVETKKALEELNKERGEILTSLQKKSDAVHLTAEEAPIIKMVFVILSHAIEGKASDIHIEPGRERLTVRFRLNGILHPSLFLPLKVHPSIVARIKILASLKIDENRVPQDGRFSIKVGSKDYDFRVATFPTLNGEKVELRVLDPSTGLRSFEELGLKGRDLDVIKATIKKPYGLVLFTGPTGSGKTTSQYAILRILNQDSVNIITLEDPIEYSIEGINQSQIKPQIGYTFAQGLRQILRQDPNIIMIGEIRDEETADLVVNAALTGHIVLSTLHTNSSVGVVPRLTDMGVRPFLIPSALRIVISQRLIRTLCSKCKIKIRPIGQALTYLTKNIKSLPAFAKQELKITEPLFVYKAKGCDECSFTGYKGRSALYEVLNMTEEISQLILKGASESAIFEMAQKQGMLAMEQKGILKVLNGETSVEEVTRVIGEKQ